jgi:predicted nucleic acid-binding protein
MGKNDIWIAATTQVAEAALITTDKDFSHLDNVFFSVNFIDNLLV